MRLEPNISERIGFTQSLLVYKCLHGSAPAYLTDDLCQVADVEARQRLRSSSSSSLIVSRTRLLTVADWAFRCTCLEQSARSCHFCTFRGSLPVPASGPCLTFPTPVIVQCLRSDSSCFGHYNRSCLLTYLLTYTNLIYMSDTQTDVQTKIWLRTSNDLVDYVENKSVKLHLFTSFQTITWCK